jgi:CheY-like chemotaxis protein
MPTNETSKVELQEPLLVLIVDDKDSDQQNAREVFAACDIPIAFSFANSYEDALEQICYEYFDVAVVDLVLHQGEPGPHQDWEGFDLLQELLERGLNKDLTVFVHTGFGEQPQVTREAFYTFEVADLWDKRDPRSKLVASLRHTLERKNYFGLTSQVTFHSSLDWQKLVANLKLPLHKLSSTVDAKKAEIELRHLLRRLLPEANTLDFSPMDQGASGSGVLRVTPIHEKDGQAADVIVKYGPIASVRREFGGWQLVHRFIRGYKSTQILNVVLGRHLAALEYSLVGANLSTILSFSKFYAGASVDNVTLMLKKLLNETCGLWYSNLQIQGTSSTSLADCYSDYLGFSKENIEQAFRFKYPEWPLTEDRLGFAVLPRKVLHPIAAFCNGRADFSWDTRFCLTHGDLHAENIRVAPETGDAWLIDFGRAGYGHWARDFAELEAAIKFQLAQDTDLPALFEFEDALAASDSLDDDLEFHRDDCPDLQKAFHSIKALRKCAAGLVGEIGTQNALREYFAALFYTTINYIRLHRLIRGRNRKNHVLVSAALVLEKLLNLASLSAGQ